MPKQTQSNITGRTGERWFWNQLPVQWIVQLPSEDIGVDGVVVILEQGEINGCEFNVQIKSSSKFSMNTDYIKLNGIKQSTLQYWAQNFNPTLLVAYDKVQNRGWCCWVQDLINQVKNLKFEFGATTIRMPKHIEVNDSCWSLIKKDLADFRGYRKWFYLEQTHTLPYLFRISEALFRLGITENVLTEDGKEESEEQINFLFEQEIMAYLEFYRILVEIERNIQEKSKNFSFIKQLRTSFELIATLYIPNFLELREVADGVHAVEHIPSMQSDVRKRLRHLMISILHRFLKPYDNKQTITQQKS